MIQFDAGQRQQAIRLLEQLAWGDMDNAIRGLEAALRLALEATLDSFAQWEESLAPEFEAHGYDEFSLPQNTIENLTSDARLAYLARLLRSLALSYGVSAGFGGTQDALVGEAYKRSPAALLRGMNDIVWMPTPETVALQGLREVVRRARGRSDPLATRIANQSLDVLRHRTGKSGSP